MPHHLTRPSSRGDTGRSLNQRQRPGTLAASRFFCIPHSARRAFARPARSMAVSGIRKDPVVPLYEENTATLFGWLPISQNKGGSMPNTIKGASAPNELSGDLIVVISDSGFSEYHGTRAHLEAEGVIPKETEWPVCYGDLRWQSGRFDYWLRRQRPAGAKGPRKQFIDCDWWCLRWELSNQPYCQKEIQRKAKELADITYRFSAKGEAENNVRWNLYWKARSDKRFQAFLATIPGFVLPKRGRKAGKSEGASA